MPDGNRARLSIRFPRPRRRRDGISEREDGRGWRCASALWFGGWDCAGVFFGFGGKHRGGKVVCFVECMGEVMAGRFPIGDGLFCGGVGGGNFAVIPCADRLNAALARADSILAFLKAASAAERARAASR